MKDKLKKILKLFLIFTKIGAFTFGGGQAMIPLIEYECVNKNKWIDEEDMKNMITIAESTPGPLAINSATFVGYKVAGFLGALFSTIGVVIPSFLIICLLSVYLTDWLNIPMVANAFKGIKCAVVVLLFCAFLRLIKKSKTDVISILITVFTFILMIVGEFFNLPISSIYLILIGGLIALSAYFFKKRGKNK